MSSVLRIYSQIYLKLLQTKKTRAFYVFIKVYLYEQTEKQSGHCLPLRYYHYFTYFLHKWNNTSTIATKENATSKTINLFELYASKIFPWKMKSTAVLNPQAKQCIFSILHLYLNGANHWKNTKVMINVRYKLYLICLKTSFIILLSPAKI